MIKYILILMALPSMVAAQVNLIQNGSFEGDFINVVPLRFEDMYQNGPPLWEEYVLTNSDDDEKWLTDSVFPAPTNINLPYTPYNNAYFNPNGCGTLLPFDSSTFVMPASNGRFFVGFNNSNDGNREGLQQDLGCKLNSGYYTLTYDWARPYQCALSQFKFHLSKEKDTRGFEISAVSSTNANTNQGTWYSEFDLFHLDLNNNQQIDNDWLVVTGGLNMVDNLSAYVFLDNVNLYRSCDSILRCYPTAGQICPSITAHLAPLDPLTITNIDNVRDLNFKLYNNLFSLIMDTTYHNENGMPPFTLSRLALPLNISSAEYHYVVELSNYCGAMRTETGTITVEDTALYNPVPRWTDPTANWTGVPIPCCLNTLTLQNTQIVGDVSFIVRNEIIVQGGVSLAPNSHVTLQAGNVTELSSVDFDGSNSSLEIIEVPCPNRMACGDGCGGGAMVIDAGQFVIPETLTSFEDSVENLVAIKSNTTSPLTEEIATVKEVSLNAYPNPFAKDIQIGFELPEEMVCSLIVTDLHLRTVNTALKDRQMPAGINNLSLDLSHLPSGVYFVKLDANGRTFHQRVVKQ